ncbi:lantibiotic dehydratase [Nonomuraea endophytica]|uniref:lantibiotic dehydratase n=1 Tax=Nonomuraea endophytica TaxID=714136 RepID=UPI0037CCA21E
MTVRMGASGLLRVAGFPAHLWLQGSNPELFTLIRSLRAAGLGYRDAAAALAEVIGRDLVPRAGRDRGWALAVRRRLHRGGPLTAAEAERLTGHGLRVGDVLAVLDHGLTVAELERLAVQAVREEERRLLGRPWELAQKAPEVERAMRQADPELFDDIRRRVAAGESWDSKRMRRRDGYLWRLIDRGATKPTPRGWFAQVALVRPEESASGHALSGATAWQWTENLHAGRNGEAAFDEPGALLTVTPLHWFDGDTLVAWVTRLDGEVSVTEVRVRRIPLLESVRAALRPGAMTVEKLEESIAVPDRRVLRPFLAHLADIGLVEVCRPPRTTVSGWARPLPQPPDRDGFLDVYRRAAGVLAPGREVESELRQVFRLLTLMRDDAPPAVPEEDFAEEPALSLFRRRLETARPHRHAPADGWPLPRTEGSGYASLIAWLDGEAGEQPVVIPDLGAGDEELSWPVDCLLRPLPGAGAAFDALAPAAALDARFADALHTLYGPPPHVTAYRRFLERVERETGYLFVEVLVPPLSVRAANAVRRPRYTRAWTGDADLASYCGDTASARYIPLDTIMIRRKGGRIGATVDGRPIWPILHSTRVAIPPWDLLAGILQAAAPTPLGRPLGIDLRTPLTALPGRAFLPRVMAGDRLVISAAQWRVGRAKFWSAGEPALRRAQALDALRERLGLPRWVLVTDPLTGGRVRCDLESLRAVTAIDRMLIHDPETITVTEALPAPVDYPVTTPSPGPAARHAAQLMVRLPMDVCPDDLARRTARAINADGERR